MEHAQRAGTHAFIVPQTSSLNPYFNGTCSKSNSSSRNTNNCRIVLILILMEHAQRDTRSIRYCRNTRNSLNPYFNGTCSKSSSNALYSVILNVLILILMEHAQRDIQSKGNAIIKALS